MRELSLHVMDIAQNSIAAGASLIAVRVQECTKEDRLTIVVEDNGKGMTEEQVKQVCDPFYTTRTTRKVGLGIPLFQMAARMTGGDVSIASTPGVGTTVTAVFVPSHVDMIPLGDINSTILLLITCNPERDFLFERTVDGRSLELDTRKLRDILGGEVPLNSPDVTQWIKDYLREQSETIIGGASER